MNWISEMMFCVELEKIAVDTAVLREKLSKVRGLDLHVKKIRKHGVGMVMPTEAQDKATSMGRGVSSLRGVVDTEGKEIFGRVFVDSPRRLVRRSFPNQVRPQTQAGRQAMRDAAVAHELYERGTPL